MSIDAGAPRKGDQVNARGLPPGHARKIVAGGKNAGL